MKRKIPWIPLAALAATWSLFSLWLHLAGERPSAPFVLFPRETFYAWQALALPALVALTTLCAHALLRRAAATPNAAYAHGRAWSGAYLFLYLLPEMIIYAVWGFDALSRAFRITFPLANLALGVALSLALRGHTTKGRALAGAALGLVIVAVFLAPVVR